MFTKHIAAVFSTLVLGLAFGAERGFEGVHPVSPTFQSFYDGIGGAWRLGTPVSGELVEQIDGVEHAVQYFQKGRLERRDLSEIRHRRWLRSRPLRGGAT